MYMPCYFILLVIGKNGSYIQNEGMFVLMTGEGFFPQ